MNTKNRLIKRLLEVAKKHKILTYPVLALVAIISVLGYFFDWSTGAGKRVIAIVMVMVMLVSQSYFLTSSANALVDSSEAESTQQDLQANAQEEALVDMADDGSAQSDEEQAEEKVETSTEVSSESEDLVQAEPEEEANVGESGEEPGDLVDAPQDTSQETVMVNEALPGDDSEDTAVEMSGESVKDTEEGGGEEGEEENITCKVFITANMDGTSQTVEMTAPAEAITKLNDTIYCNLSKVKKDGLSIREYLDTHANKFVNNAGYYGYGESEFYDLNNVLVDLSSSVETTLQTNNNNPEYVVRLKVDAIPVMYRLTVNEYYQNGALLQNAEYFVPREGSITSKTVALSNFSRFGYEVADVITTLGDAEISKNTVDQVITGAEVYVKSDCTVTVQWSEQSFNIEYYDEDSSTLLETETHIYGDNSLINDGSYAPEKTGYVMDYWTLEGVSVGRENVKASDLYKEDGGKPVTLKLVAHYDYKKIKWLETTLPSDFTYSCYSDLSQSPVVAVYQDGSTNDNFIYKILSTAEGSNASLRGVAVAYANPGADQGTGGLKITYDPENVTPGNETGTSTITVLVTDPDSKNESEQEGSVATLTFNVKVDPCDVQLIPPSILNTSKPYDGTTNSSLTGQDITCKLARSCSDPNMNGTEVEGATVSFSDVVATYVSPDATVSYKDQTPLSGDGKVKILLDSQTELNVPAGYHLIKVNSNYASIDGSIVQLPLFVGVKSTKDTIRTGESFDMGTCSLYEPGDNSKLAAQDKADGKTLQDVVGEYEYVTDQRDLSVVSGDVPYKIIAKFDNTGNYEVSTSDEYAHKYHVVQDSVNGNYVVTGDEGENGWYTSVVTLSPAETQSGPTTHYYDTVQVSVDFGHTWMSPGTGTSYEITEEKSEQWKDKAIWVRLLNSETGAFTGYDEISPCYKIDSTAPEFSGFSVNYENDGIINSGTDSGSFSELITPGFNSLEFGNFFKNTITVNIKYTDATSGLDTLHVNIDGAVVLDNYTVDENGGVEIPFDPATGIASFSILNLPNIEAKIGNISFYAIDKAGNDSSANGAEGVRTLSYNGQSAWYVEKEQPTAVLSVVAGESHNVDVVSGSPIYYNHCRAQLSVTDEQSGVFDVDWYIGDTEISMEDGPTISGIRVEEEDRHDRKKTYTFTQDINDTNFANATGEYKIFAVVRDNAGNEVISNEMIFKVDDVPPVIDNLQVPRGYKTSAIVTFDVYDELSGLSDTGIGIVDSEGNRVDGWSVSAVQDGVSTVTLNTERMTQFTPGIYYIVAVDKAGNLITEEQKEEFKIDLSLVSDAKPACPTVTLSPETPDGKNGWYVSYPTITVTADTMIGDSIPVATQYQYWLEGETDLAPRTLDSTGTATLETGRDGVYNLQIQSRAETGMECAAHTIQPVKVDKTAPKIQIVPGESTGSAITIQFKIQDAVSGVDADSVVVKHGNDVVENASITKTEDKLVEGSFVVTATGQYTISVADKAGNVSNEEAFSPMSMKISSVKNISEDSATLGAKIIKGTYGIQSVSLSYKKAVEADSEYREVSSLTGKDADGNWPISAVLNQLEPGTSYAFKIEAVSEANEYLDYVGYFKTLSTNEIGILISGMAKHADSTNTQPITVGLYKGNECIRAVVVNELQNSSFTFSNVPDGTYNVMATDGTYSKTARVVIENGRMTEPYSGRVTLVLSGESTSVEITTETGEIIDIAVENLESLFNQRDDELIHAADGSVESIEYKLCAKMVTVSNVEDNAKIAVHSAASNPNKVVGAWLDLTLHRIETDIYGNRVDTMVTDTQEASGVRAYVSVTIPLGEMASKSGLEVVRVHKTGNDFLGQSLRDEDGPNNSTYTISTTLFSTYAVLHDPDVATTEPTTEATTQPTTEATTQAPALAPQAPVTPPVVNNTPSKKNNKDKNKDVAKNDSNGTTLGSLKSSSSAKTGDETPIAVLGTMMLVAAGGFFMLRRKIK